MLYNVKCDATGDKHGKQHHRKKQKRPVFMQYKSTQMEKTQLVLGHPDWGLLVFRDAVSTF
jgi:hypothetical protein